MTCLLAAIAYLALAVPFASALGRHPAGRS